VKEVHQGQNRLAQADIIPDEMLMPVSLRNPAQSGKI
jgi:hypothetical protein